MFGNTGEWPKWSKLDEAGIARYVTTGARLWIATKINGIDSDKITRKQMLQSIYDSLCERQIKYSLEKFDRAEATQLIRTPAEVLELPGEGTCLDLAVCFAGICLACELLPILIVLKQHAFVVVSLKHGLRDWKLRPEFKDFAPGPIKELSVIRDLVEQESFVAIECTGFAHINSTSTAQMSPELARGPNGLLSFQSAMDIGREKLRTEGGSLRFGIDIAIAHYYWYISPYPLPERPHEREMARRRKYVLAAFASLVVFFGFLFVLFQQWKILDARTNQLQQEVLHDLHVSELAKAIRESDSGIRASLLKRFEESFRELKTLSDSDDREILEICHLESRKLIALIAGDSPYAAARLLEVLNENSSPANAQLRSYLIHETAMSGITSDWIMAQVDKAADKPTALHGFLLLLGEYPKQDLTRDKVLPYVEQLFVSHNDPGVHAAARWLLLSRLGEEGKLVLHDKTEMLQNEGVDRLRGKDSSSRQWYVDRPSGITFVYFPKNAKFRIGDIDFDRLRKNGMTGLTNLSPIPSKVTIPRGFLISMTEVTEEQYNRFDGVYEIEEKHGNEFAAVEMTWERAANFCNRLTNSPGDYCYEQILPNGCKKKDNHLSLEGFRLPTEAEWEFSCRAGTDARFSFGNDPELLPAYAWIGNRDIVGSIRPNSFGLFDCHGGVAEWCDDQAKRYPLGSDRVDEESADKGVLNHVFRGGHFEVSLSDHQYLTSFYRNSRPPLMHYSAIGFRIARTVNKFPPNE